MEVTPQKGKIKAKTKRSGAVLSAPKKELIWFEHSGHGCMINDNDLFIKETLRVFQDD